MTLKQKLFVKKYLEKNGNATKAALEVYNVKNLNTAHVIGAENLQKPTIKRSIEVALERKGLSDEYISELLREVTVSGIGKKATNSDSLRGLDMLLKLKGAYPTVIQKSAHLSIVRKENLEDLDYDTLLAKLNDLNEKTRKLMGDIS